MNIESVNRKVLNSTAPKNVYSTNENHGFQIKLEAALHGELKKDEYISVVDQRSDGCEIYESYKISAVLENDLPLETDHYKIEKADKCYSKDFVITNKKNNQKLYLNQKEIIIQEDEKSGIKFIFDTSAKDIIQPNMVVDEDLEKILKGWTQKTGRELMEKPLQGYTINTDDNTGIRYINRNGQLGSGADILLLTEEDEQIFEQIVQAYLGYANIANDDEEARTQAAMEVSGNSKRCEKGVLRLAEGYLSFTSYDGREENSWSQILDGKSSYEAAYKKLQCTDTVEIEKEDFWKELFQNNKEDSSGEKENGTESDIVTKADGSRVLVITMKISGMESTISIEISKPTDVQDLSANNSDKSISLSDNLNK